MRKGVRNEDKLNRPYLSIGPTIKLPGYLPLQELTIT